MTGGTAPSSQSGSGQSSVTLNNYTSPPTGFTFAGWASRPGD
jgi:hypothetical protein